jgi:RNA polymerase subunit RPABC4/transcription elongation factor Spt4
MMYMHYCKRCHRVYMLNGHKQSCPKCHEGITELKISYMDYVSMDRTERSRFTAVCSDEKELSKMSTTYRMYKYSKWYKELQEQCAPTSIIPYVQVIPDRTRLAKAVLMG